MDWNAKAVKDAEALITAYFDAFNRRDVGGMLALLDEEVVHDVNQGERRFGADAFEQFLIHMNRCYREELRDIVIMVSENGLRAAAEFTVHGEYLATDEGLPDANGQRYGLAAGTFFSIDGGKIARVATTYNLNDWIRQVS